MSRYGDFCDTAAEDRIALDAQGRITDATPGAARLLSLATSQPIATPALIDQRLADLSGVDDLEQWLDGTAPSIQGAHGKIHARLVAGGRPRAAPIVTDVSPARSPWPHRARALPLPRPAEPPQLPDGVDPASALGQAMAKAVRVHACRLPVLLQGETGTGKTQLARHLHATGPSRQGRFVTINCAAIPAELIESELFGYRPGAYTGASSKGSPGRILAAQGGTLFLDEIGDMPMALQSRLLQVLSEGELVPVGGVDAVAVDFALISASLHNLQDLVAAGRFRQDLYYRLMGACVTLPPLRQRGDRQRVVVQAFRHAAQALDLPMPSLAEDALAALTAYHWPGNLRELDHVARVTLAVCRDQAGIARQDLPEACLQHGGARLSATNPQGDAPALALASAQALQAWLERWEWNVKAAAAALGVSRATLHRRIVQWNLQRPLRVRRRQ